jgi:hypothetical protein
MPLPEDPRRATWDTLQGRKVADLEALVAARASANAPAGTLLGRAN